MFYAGTAITLLLIGLLVWIILKIREWFFESDDSDATIPEMLGQFRHLKLQGDLTEEEYRLISQRLSEKTESSSTLTSTTKGIGSSKQQPTQLSSVDEVLPLTSSLETQVMGEDLPSERKPEEINPTQNELDSEGDSFGTDCNDE